MSKIVYFSAQAFRHIRRNTAVAGITVGTVAIVFLLLCVLALVGHNLDRFGQGLKAGLYLVVYLEDHATEQQAHAIKSVLESSKSIASVSFTNREQALEIFKKRLGAQATLLEELDPNSLPASFEARLSSIERSTKTLNQLAQKLVSMPGVEQVQYGQAWLERFFNFMDFSRLIAFMIGALLVFATLMIVSNTIRLSVYARTDEIHILKLVGATDNFVKAPFYIEGVLFGGLGALLGIAGAWVLFAIAQPLVTIPLGPSSGNLLLEFLPVTSAALLAGGGALVGIMGTLASLGRHLRI